MEGFVLAAAEGRFGESTKPALQRIAPPPGRGFAPWLLMEFHLLLPQMDLPLAEGRLKGIRDKCHPGMANKTPGNPRGENIPLLAIAAPGPWGMFPPIADTSDKRRLEQQSPRI